MLNQGLGNLFGSKHGYKVPPNQVKAVVKILFCVCPILFLLQELLAQGVSNLVGSFMSCLPMSGSLSRSLVQVEQLNIENSNPLKLVIQESSGCKSLLTGLTSAIFLLGVLLFLGPIFQVLWRQSCLL